MIEVLDFTCERFKKAQQRWTRDANRREASLSVGDEVLLLTEGLQIQKLPSKLTSRYIDRSW
jgi:hypothetical protein